MLSELQQRVAGIVAGLADADDFVLAGGAASSRCWGRSIGYATRTFPIPRARANSEGGSRDGGVS